jgi:hypothetical protein
VDRTTTRQRRPATTTEVARPAGADPVVQVAYNSDAGSALMLVPAMLLVLICLGGIAIDLTVVHGAHRGAHRSVTAAADDAAAMIDSSLLQQTGELRIDPTAARQVALSQMDPEQLPGRIADGPWVIVDDSGTVATVGVVLDIDHVMLRALPGHPDDERITVVAQARLNR